MTTWKEAITNEKITKTYDNGDNYDNNRNDSADF